MKLLARCLLPSLLSSAAFATEDTEPPLSYTLKLDGKEVHIPGGQETTVEGAFQNPKITVVPDPLRHFNAHGIKFDYPSYFSFQFRDLAKGSKLWTLKGTRATLMVHSFPGKVTAEEHAKALLKVYGDRGSSTPVTHSLHGVEITGVRVRLAVSEAVPIFEDVLALPVEKSSCILIIQDRPDGDQASEDEKQTEKILSDSLSY